MEYLKFCEEYTKAKLIPIDHSPYQYLEDHNKPYFTSLVKYSEEDYQSWKKTKSLAGITNSKTSTVWFDLDWKDDLDVAFSDGITLFNRLTDLGMLEENIQVSFSGNKGLSIVVDLDIDITVKDVKSFANNLAGDLKSFDGKIYDNQRIFRLLFTKNEKSGLYKVPINKHELFEKNIDEIKEVAKDIIGYGTIEDFKKINYKTFSVNDRFKEKLIFQTKEVKQLKDVVFGQTLDVNSVSMENKPKFLDTPRWYLQNGFFQEGDRNDAFVCLAATYKNLGFNKEITYRMLKGVAENQAQRTGMERYSDKKIYNEVIQCVFSPTWRNGQFTTKDPTNWLYQYCERYNIPKGSEEFSRPIMIGEAGSAFVEYCQSFKENRIFTGLADLDQDFPITAGSNIGIIGAASSGKCLGKGTPVLMYDGSIKKVEEILVNDLLMGDDSTPRKVLSLARGKEQMYKVHQSNGDNYIVNESHILSLKASYCGKRKYSYPLVQDIDVKSYLNENKNFKKIFKGYKVGIEFSEKTLDINPYLLGYWLGDGSSNKCEFTISESDVENILPILKSTLPKGCSIENRHQPSASGNCQSVTIKGIKMFNPFLKSLKKYNLWGNKHIPHIYLTASRQQRLELLAGLIDTDGSKFTGTSYGYEFTLKQTQLSKDIVYLVRSLGFRVSLKNKKRKWKSFTKGKLYEGEGVYDHLHVSGDNVFEIPVKYDRKKYHEFKNRRTHQDLCTIKLEKLDIDDYYGFVIDGNHRFLLGDFTVTHNTAYSLNILENSAKQGIVSIFASLDMSKSRLYEKMLYKVTGGKFTREEIFQKYLDGQGGMFDEMVKERFPNVYIFNKSAPSVEQMRDYILDVQEVSGQPVRLLMIDYFERLTSTRVDENSAGKEIANSIQDIVNDFPKLVPITLVQPNKASLSLGPDSPIVSYTAIKGSSFLYQSFRQILSIWRPFFNPKDKSKDQFMEMSILKNDLGELGSYKYKWFGKTGEITPFKPGDEELYNRYMNEKKQRLSDDANGDGFD